MCLFLVVFGIYFANAANALTVKKGDGYKPFSIHSTKLKKDMSDAYIIKNLMCYSTREKLADNLRLLQDYDLIGTDPTDGSLTFTKFAGKQGGKPAEIDFVVDSNTHILTYVLLNGDYALTCW